MKYVYVHYALKQLCIDRGPIHSRLHRKNCAQLGEHGVQKSMILSRTFLCAENESLCADPSIRRP